MNRPKEDYMYTVWNQRFRKGGENKITNNSKGWVFFILKMKRVFLVKRVEQRWDLDHTSQNFEVEE